MAAEANTVCMIHPNLPGQPIYVDPLAVPHYRKRGWKLCPKSAATLSESAESAEPTADESPAPPRRRSTKKEAH